MLEVGGPAQRPEDGHQVDAHLRGPQVVGARPALGEPSQPVEGLVEDVVQVALARGRGRDVEDEL